MIATTPLLAVRDGAVHAVFADNRRGSRTWNTWYRTSDDGGRTWFRVVRISDAVSGPTYVGHRGYASTYGDYAGMAATEAGVIVTWGEGASQIGPGGTWINRTT